MNIVHRHHLCRLPRMKVTRHSESRRERTPFLTFCNTDRVRYIIIIANRFDNPFEIARNCRIDDVKEHLKSVVRQSENDYSADLFRIANMHSICTQVFENHRMTFHYSRFGRIRVHGALAKYASCAYMI